MSLDALNRSLESESARKLTGEGVDVWVTPNAELLSKRFNREDLIRVTREAFERTHGSFTRHSEPLLSFDREAPGLLFATARVKSDSPYHMIVFTYCEPQNWIALLTDAYLSEQQAASG